MQGKRREICSAIAKRQDTEILVLVEPETHRH